MVEEQLPGFRRDRRSDVPAPGVTAIPCGLAAHGGRQPLLSRHQQQELVKIASVAHIKRGSLLFKEGARADAIYNVCDGVVKTWRRVGGARVVTAFLFTGDLVGLCEGGRYIDSAETVTSTTVYRIPLPALERLLKHDPLLGYQFLCKLCHELRESQRHAIALSQNSAAAKLAMFLLWLESQDVSARPNGTIRVPMKRADISDYVGLSFETISRTFGALERAGIIAPMGRHHVRIRDRSRLETLVPGSK
jgi:CRP-like cAMP-binding protein